MSNIIEIKDLTSPELDIYSRLSEKQLFHYNEPQTGLFISESPIVTERALDAGYEPISMLVDKKERIKANNLLCRYPNLPVYTAEHEVLKSLTGFELTRGLLCAMRRKPLPSVEEICKNKTRIAVLENVMNPTNVGAIFRSAAALNIDALLLTPACCDPLYRRSIRVSMGTVFQIPWTFFEHTAGGQTPTPVPILKELGFKTAAMALSKNSVPIDYPPLLAEEKLAIILGTEGEGLSDSTIRDSDYTVMIPMAHGVDSLNVAAASAVAFWQFGHR